MRAKADCRNREVEEDYGAMFSSPLSTPSVPRIPAASLEDGFSDRGDLAPLSFMCVMKACV